MFFKKHKGIVVLTSLVLVALITAGIFVVDHYSNSRAKTKKAQLEQAIALREKGNYEDALYMLELYLADYPDDVDANTLMGDWYAQDDNIEKALYYYAVAAESIDYPESTINSANLFKSFLNTSDISFTVKPAVRCTSNMSLTFSSNLFRISDEFEYGSALGTAAELKSSDAKTSQWFAVDSSEKKLTLFGETNCAIWQFMDKYNNIISGNKDKNTINSLDNVRYTNKFSSTVDIPKDAVKARVTYYDPTIENSLPFSEGAYIQYGSYLSGYASTHRQTIALPDLTSDQYIEYKDGNWTLYEGETSTELELDSVPKDISGVSADGTLIGMVEFADGLNEDKEQSIADSDKSKRYGIKYKTDGSSFLCERVDDANGMRFDYTIDNEWAGSGVNDFDNAYPWCDIRLCNVKQDKDSTKITYQDESDFSLDGKNGNVMVEIPKFYSKRLVQDGYDYIWISGTKHSGFELDPAFIGTDNKELDYIYVAAYQSSYSDKALVSCSESYPAIKLNLNNIRDGAEENGSRFAEMDYLTYSALQRLFLVETGNINSSSLFEGISGDYFFFSDSKKSGYAVKSAEDTNTIVLKSNSSTARLQTGDSITILDADWDSYKNNSSYQREITSIKNNEENKTLTIEFSGEPLNIKEGVSAISNIPTINGRTDSIDYCTGIQNRGEGKSSFKYRGIENLYGNLCVILDNAYFKKNEFTYANGAGKEFTISDAAVTQNEPVSDYTAISSNFCIKSMTYNKDNPLVMLPSKLGSGATALTAFGDYWMLQVNEDSNSKRYLAVGGANDNFSIAGLFHMRAFISEKNTDETAAYLGSRIIYRAE